MFHRFRYTVMISVVGVAIGLASPTYASAARAANDLSARALLVQAAEVAGGETWLRPRTLIMSGTADFYAPAKSAPISHSDDYRMWRAMNPDRSTSHAADGMVRIRARTGPKLLFEVGFDGTTTWNERGIVPKAEADAYWASAFGFGVIRQALNDGFTVERAPDRSVDGHMLDMVRIVDNSGQQTLFGLDRKSHYIRYMGFATPKGWHERTYDDFVMLQHPRWLQARTVTLFYNGVRSNTVYWKDIAVNQPLPAYQFSQPAKP